MKLFIRIMRWQVIEDPTVCAMRLHNLLSFSSILQILSELVSMMHDRRPEDTRS